MLTLSGRDRDLLDLRWSALKDGVISGHRRKDGEEYVVVVSDALRAALGAPGHPTAYMAGRPYSVTTIARYWRKAKRIAGITRRCRFKDLRHTFACNLINRGAPLAAVGKALGHAWGSPSTALYAEVERETAIKMQREALAKAAC